MQDNQLFAVSSYLVGVNQLQPADESTFIGRSAIFAPQELTPRFNGVLVEMGNQASEGVVTAEWDFAALKHLWETSETPLRRDLPLPQVNKLLAALYEQVRGMPTVDRRRTGRRRAGPHGFSRHSSGRHVSPPTCRPRSHWTICPSLPASPAVGRCIR